MALQYDIVNLGTDAIANWYAEGIFLSVDSTLSLDDAFLGVGSHDQTQDIPPNGGIHFGDAFAVIPPGTPSGTHFLLVLGDVFEDVAETDEFNNVTEVQIDVSP